MTNFITHLFHSFAIKPEDPESFFTNAERSLIVREILDRTKFPRRTQAGAETFERTGELCTIPRDPLVQLNWVDH